MKVSHSVKKPAPVTESGKKDTTAGSYDKNRPVQDVATEDAPGDRNDRDSESEACGLPLRKGMGAGAA